MGSCAVALAVATPTDSPSSCFFLAVIASSLYGGKGPGIVSVLLSSLAFDYFFLPPKYSFWIEPTSYPRLAAFLGAVLLIEILIEGKRRVEAARRETEAKYRQASADALAEARRSEARLRLIINSIPAPAWSSGADGATDFVNQRWLDYTGIPMDQALGWGWKVAYHPDDLDRNAEYWRSVLESPDEERELEGRLRRFDGAYRWFLFRVSPLRDESGQVLQWYAWPGNVRELQNVIERSVIFCDEEVFSVDPSWLSFESSPHRQTAAPNARKPAAEEKEVIETALAATGGRVSGPFGAASQLGVPASTLESRIRSLRINKFRFRKI